MSGLAYAHPQIDRPPDGMGGPFAAALLFHLLLSAVLGGWTWWVTRSRPTFGDPNSFGGGVTVTAVNTIPVANRSGPVQPVARDTESQVPSPPKPQQKRARRDDPDAVDLGRKDKKKQKLTPWEKKLLEAQKTQYARQEPDRNRVSSTTGAAARSPMFSTTSTGSGVGVGVGNPFGTAFGWYGQLVTERIAQKWRTEGLSMPSRPRATVSFDILQDGNVANVRIIEGSNNYALDTSVKRAVLEAAPFPPLPQGFGRRSASVEIVFNLQR